MNPWKWYKEWLSFTDYATIAFIATLIGIYWLYFD